MKTWVMVLLISTEGTTAAPTVLDGFDTFYTCMTAAGKILSATEEMVKPGPPGFPEMKGASGLRGRFTCVEISKTKEIETTEHQGSALSPLR